MPLIQRHERAMCSAVTSPLMRDATWFSETNISSRFTSWQQFADVATEALHVAVLHLVEPQHAEVDADAVVREHAGDLAADDHVGPVGDRERAGDAVVVRDRDEVHAARLGAPVDPFGRVVRLAQQAARQRIVDGPNRPCGRGCRLSLGLLSHPSTKRRRLGWARGPSVGRPATALGGSVAAACEAAVQERCRARKSA